MSLRSRISISQLAGQAATIKGIPIHEATFKSLIIMYDGNRTHNKAWIETDDDVEITKRLPTIEVL